MHEFISLALAALLLLVGGAHLLVPRMVEPLVPSGGRRHAQPSCSLASSRSLGIGLVIDGLRGPALVAAGLLFLGYTVVHLDDLRHADTATRFSDRAPGVQLRGLSNLAYAGSAVYVAPGVQA